MLSWLDDDVSAERSRHTRFGDAIVVAACIAAALLLFLHHHAAAVHQAGRAPHAAALAHAVHLNRL